MSTAQALVNPPAEASPDTQCCRRCPTPLIHERHPEPREGWRPHFGRGLCEPCWKDAKAKDELVDYERSTRTRDEVLDEWDFLRRAGVTRREAAERIGVRLDSLDRQICRARRAGDPRAVYGTRGPAPITKEKETHDMSKGKELARKVLDGTVNTVLAVAEAPRRALDQYERDAYTYGDGFFSWRHPSSPSKSAASSAAHDDDAPPSWFGGPANTDPPRSSLAPTSGHSANYRGNYDSKGEYAKGLGTDDSAARPETHNDAWWRSVREKLAAGAPARDATASADAHDTAVARRPETAAEQRIERLQELGDQRTERQTALMNRAMENKAAAARTDALDRQWDDTCGRDDCGEDSNGRPTYRSPDAAPELLCDPHAMEPTEMDAASVGAYWDVIADGGSADEATAAAASRQIEQDRARQAGQAWQREAVTGDERVDSHV